MPAPGRLATALAVVAVSVALPFARTPAEPAHPVPTVSFSAMGLSFRYPATWRARTWNDVSRITSRQFVAVATASFSWASDQLRSDMES